MIKRRMAVLMLARLPFVESRSFPRKREPRGLESRWVPAFAGTSGPLLSDLSIVTNSVAMATSSDAHPAPIPDRFKGATGLDPPPPRPILRPGGGRRIPGAELGIAGTGNFT